MKSVTTLLKWFSKQLWAHGCSQNSVLAQQSISCCTSSWHDVLSKSVILYFDPVSLTGGVVLLQHCVVSSIAGDLQAHSDCSLIRLYSNRLGYALDECRWKAMHKQQDSDVSLCFIDVLQQTPDRIDSYKIVQFANMYAQKYKGNQRNPNQ